MKAEIPGKVGAEAKNVPVTPKPQPSSKSSSKHRMGAGTKVVLTTVIGVPVILLAGMKWGSHSEIRS